MLGMVAVISNIRGHSPNERYCGPECLVVSLVPMLVSSKGVGERLTFKGLVLSL